MNKKYFLIAAGIMIVFLIFGGIIMGKVQEPSYVVLEQEDNIEIREYDPVIRAYTVVNGERKQALHDGFLVLADYIFGNNRMNDGEHVKIPMSAPVAQRENNGGWEVSFFMPDEKSIQLMPQPMDSRVVLKEDTLRRVAVIRFSGLGQDRNLNEYLEKLQAFLKERNLQTKGSIVYAFYDPPWSLPVLRRNEIMIELANN